MKYFANLGILCITILTGCQSNSEEFDKINVLELTISDIHEAYRSGDYTSEDLVKAYLKRIESYDRSNGLNAIITVNPEALDNAGTLDTEYQTTDKLRPLHGIPVIVKDNYQTKGLITTAGSVAFKDFIPEEDAY